MSLSSSLSHYIAVSVIPSVFLISVVSLSLLIMDRLYVGGVNPIHNLHRFEFQY